MRGVRSTEVSVKISRHLQRFAAWIIDGLGHDRLSAVTPREVSAWRDHLAAVGNRGRDGTPAPMAPVTVNNHLAHLSALFSWITAHAPASLLRHGDPTKKVAPLPLAAPQPRALAAAQVRTVKSIVDRIETFHEVKGRRHRGTGARAHAHARPLRDRAIIYLLFGTGLRRAELVGLDLDQLEPAGPDRLRQAKEARLTGVRGKGRTSRTVFLGRDARQAPAGYLAQERPGDAAASTVAGTAAAALLLSASSIAARRPDGRLSPRSINTIVAEVGRLHDAQNTDLDRRLGALRPHDVRHSFAFQLSQASGHNRAELERRLGHADDRYLPVHQLARRHRCRLYRGSLTQRLRAGARTTGAGMGGGCCWSPCSRRGRYWRPCDCRDCAACSPGCRRWPTPCGSRATSKGACGGQPRR
ncbi:tyrosine-type recombinase/integrase [Nonomuraea fuscirosea]|uniref:tyrosine-type recombinase/integrase n=1 Tax=Nonomuraea fuscirosea TaxID=1291556 RepID=UPI002DD99911|nr:tyrosine-type recombinase/integrase [Nonomuraea fuscirosea]WSA48315.1 tyrosine-type recombinase/integrase [Nonomuraea fuscirosea]